MDMVRLRDLEDYDKLPRTKWNIKQPSDDDDREEALDTEGGLDLILIPGLAFTRAGARCGRGKGYYDTYLAKVHQKQGRLPATVALAFKEQILGDVPTDDHDVRIDKVLFTESWGSALFSKFPLPDCELWTTNNNLSDIDLDCVQIPGLLLSGTNV